MINCEMQEEGDGMEPGNIQDNEGMTEGTMRDGRLRVHIYASPGDPLDGDLYVALAGIRPRRRAAWIKTILRDALAGRSSVGKISSPDLIPSSPHSLDRHAISNAAPSRPAWATDPPAAPLTTTEPAPVLTVDARSIAQRALGKFRTEPWC